MPLEINKKNPTKVEVVDFETDVVTKKSSWVKANYVSIVDIDAPLKSMALFYFKWSFAVIPTAIFWTVIWLFLIKPIVIDTMG